MVPSQSHHITRLVGEGQKLLEEAGNGPLDLYRITDRFDQIQGNTREINDFRELAKQVTPGCSDSSCTSDQLLSTDGLEDIPECPTPILFKRTLVSEVTGAVLDTKIEKRSCNNKSCPVCGGLLKRRYVGHFSQIFSKLPRLIFFTLTIDPKVGVPSYLSRMYIVNRWSRFRKRMHRKGEFVYLATPESHKSGYTHLHVVCSAPKGVSDEDLKSAWFGVGGGIVMDVQHLDKRKETPEQIVGYVMKYVFKDAAEARGRRSLLCSRGTSFHSEEFKAQRREYARKMRKERGEEVPGELDLWEPVVVGKPKKSSDTPTAEERAMFDKMAESLARTTLWVDNEKKVITYLNGEGRVVEKQMEGDATRSEISKEIHRIRALHGLP